ncbi:MAG TPA: hypothetical protein VGP68_11025 [Gemmataceae bacterium]|jgi:hypothetical protein|nr:hypothetical protein [Gemmataceae bacterium]
MGLLSDHPPIPCANPRGLRRRLLLAGLILAGVLIWLGSGRVWAQGPANDRPHYVPKSIFRIPFNVDPNNPRLLEVQLFVSEDHGQSWQKAGSAAPEQGGFHFRAEHDGLYWFTVRTVDINGKANPATVQGAPPQIRVEVDTQLPLVSLRQAPSRDGQIGVEWEIREENLDINSFLLEYRTAGSQDWIPLTVEAGRTGQRYWNPGVSGNVEARLRVRDLAKNEGEGRRVLVATNGDNGGGDSRPLGGNYNDPDAGRSLPSGSSRAEPRYVNSKRISLNYEIKEEGPSGTSAVELWATRDGRSWDKLTEDASHQPPLTVEVKEEGLYGFTIVARSGVGLSERRPRGGDVPQVWVEVDLQAPVVTFVHAEVDPGPDSGRLTIAWKATDKNLGREPIALSYSKDPEGPWTPIAPPGQPNSGSYVWRMPPSGIPYQFYVQVEATDKAGNVGKLRTKELVKVDLKKPKGVILDVAPAAAGAIKADSESNKR